MTLLRNIIQYYYPCLDLWKCYPVQGVLDQHLVQQVPQLCGQIDDVRYLPYKIIRHKITLGLQILPINNCNTSVAFQFL